MFARGQLVEPLEITRAQFAADPVFFTEPLTQIDQPAALGAERAAGRLQPATATAALWTGDFGQDLGRIHRFSHFRIRLKTTLTTRQVTMGNWNENPGRSIEMSPGSPPRRGHPQVIQAPSKNTQAPRTINCFPMPLIGRPWSMPPSEGFVQRVAAPERSYHGDPDSIFFKNPCRSALHLLA